MMRFILLLSLSIFVLAGCGGGGGGSTVIPAAPNFVGDYTGQYWTTSNQLLGTVVGYVAAPDQVALDTTNSSNGNVMQWRGTLNAQGAYNGTVIVGGNTFNATGVFAQGSGNNVSAEMQYTNSGTSQTFYYVFQITKL